MKTKFWLFVLGLAIASASCVESSKRTTMPDGTRIEEYSKQTDPAVLRFGADVARAYSPREIRRVKEEKSGPIKPQEIRERWMPVHGPALP